MDDRCGSFKITIVNSNEPCRVGWGNEGNLYCVSPLPGKFI